jgi:hypothetical protein
MEGTPETKWLLYVRYRLPSKNVGPLKAAVYIHQFPGGGGHVTKPGKQLKAGLPGPKTVFR